MIKLRDLAGVEVLLNPTSCDGVCGPRPNLPNSGDLPPLPNLLNS